MIMLRCTFRVIPMGLAGLESHANMAGNGQNSENDHVGGFAVSRVVMSMGNRRETAGNTG